MVLVFHHVGRLLWLCKVIDKQDAACSVGQVQLLLADWSEVSHLLSWFQLAYLQNIGGERDTYAANITGLSEHQT